LSLPINDPKQIVSKEEQKEEKLWRYFFIRLWIEKSKRFDLFRQASWESNQKLPKSKTKTREKVKRTLTSMALTTVAKATHINPNSSKLSKLVLFHYRYLTPIK
jgi:hypothetical protein